MGGITFQPSDDANFWSVAKRGLKAVRPRVVGPDMRLQDRPSRGVWWFHLRKMIDNLDR
jgi:hypothetical protein